MPLRSRSALSSSKLPTSKRSSGVDARTRSRFGSGRWCGLDLQLWLSFLYCCSSLIPLSEQRLLLSRKWLKGSWLPPQNPPQCLPPLQSHYPISGQGLTPRNFWIVIRLLLSPFTQPIPILSMQECSDRVFIKPSTEVFLGPLYKMG